MTYLIHCCALMLGSDNEAVEEYIQKGGSQKKNQFGYA